MMQFDSEHYSAGIAALWRDPKRIDGLTDQEFIRARAMYSATAVMQDNALYQGELGLLDGETLRAAENVVVRNFELWKKLGVQITPRMEVLYAARSQDHDV